MFKIVSKQFGYCCKIMSVTHNPKEMHNLQEIVSRCSC